MISYNLTSLGIISRATWVRRESLLKNSSSRVSWPCLVCQDLESDDAEYVRKSVTGHETPREVCECSPYAWYTLLTTPKSGLTTSTLHSPRFTFMRWRSRFNGVPAGRRYHTITGLVCPHKIKTLLSLLNPHHYAWAELPWHMIIRNRLVKFTQFSTIVPLSGFLHGTSLMGSK